MMYTSKLVLLLVLAVAVLHFGGARLHLVEAQGNVQVIQLGASLTLTQTPPTARLSSGLRTRDGMLLFMEKQHEEPLVIGNTTYIFNITILDDQGSTTRVTQNYQTLLGMSVFATLGPVNTDFGMFAKAVTEPAGKLLIGTSNAGYAFHANSQWTFAAVTSSRNLVRVAIPELRAKRVTTMVTVAENSAFTMDICAGADVDAMQAGITIVKKIIVPFSLDGLTAEERRNLTASMDEVRELNPDVVLACMYQDLQPEAARYLANNSWTPKIFIVVPDGAANWANVEDTVSDYVMGLSAIEAKANWPTNGLNFGNPFIYNATFGARFGYEPDSFAAFGTAAPLLLKLAIKKANSVTNYAGIRDALLTLSEDTFLGRYSFGADHGCQVSAFMTQYQHGAREIVAPAFAASAEMVYPMPTFEERVLNPKVGEHLEIVILVITSVGILIALAFGIVLIVHWRHTVIVASSPPFLAGMLGGGIIIMVSNFFTLTNGVTDATCHLQVWFLAVGFVVMFGSVLVKTWRVWHLYSNSSLSIIKISDKHLVLLLLGASSVSIILLVLISGVGNPKAVVQVIDEHRLALNYYACQSDMPTAFITLLSILLAYNGILIVAGLYFAYRVRVIPFSVYDESKIIAFSIYNVGLVAIVIAILELSKAADRRVLFGIRCIGVVASATITIVTVFRHKLEMIRKNLTSKSQKSRSGGSAKMNKTSTSVPSNDGDFDELKTKYTKLKEQHAELFARYEDLTSKMRAMRPQTARVEDPDTSTSSSSSS